MKGERDLKIKYKMHDHVNETFISYSEYYTYQNALKIGVLQLQFNMINTHHLSSSSVQTEPEKQP